MPERSELDVDAQGVIDTAYVACKLRVTTARVRQLVEAGQLPGEHGEHRRGLFRKDEIDMIIAARNARRWQR